MEIPKAVIKEAQYLVKRYGNKLRLLGKYEGQDAYVFEFPKDLEVGFPSVFLYDGDNPPMEVSGFDALDIISSFS